MPRLLQLTNSADRQPIIINLDECAYYYPYEAGTVFKLLDETTIIVCEPAQFVSEAINALLKKIAVSFY